MKILHAVAGLETDVGFHRVSVNEELVVRESNLECPVDDVKCPVDLSDVDLEPEQNSRLEALLKRNAAAFASREHDLCYRDSERWNQN